MTNIGLYFFQLQTGGEICPVLAEQNWTCSWAEKARLRLNNLGPSMDALILNGFLLIKEFSISSSVIRHTLSGLPKALLNMSFSITRSLKPFLSSSLKQTRWLWNTYVPLPWTYIIGCSSPYYAQYTLCNMGSIHHSQNQIWSK